MHYIGTRGSDTSSKNFEEILISALADNGGLYVPASMPKFGDIESLKGLSYQELAYRITLPFIDSSFGDGAIPKDDYRNMIDSAYASFAHDEVTPLVQVADNIWGLELFHGRTLAFKDVALSLLGELSDYVCAKQNKHITIIGATSGDTGPASMTAFANRKNATMFMLYPHGRTSDIQRKQMTTLTAKNTHAIAIKGSFDDCQDLVKALFADEKLQRTMNLAAVNSINWVRIMAQIPYYAYACLQLGKPIDVVVPTGNFGNILAAYCAKQMGFPIQKLVIASNENDILTRFITQNDMTMQEVIATWSPSIDIQVSSNFERLVFWLCDSDGEKCHELMQKFRDTGKLQDEALWQKAKDIFTAHRVSDDETLQAIKKHYEKTGTLYDPHSAIAITAAERQPSPSAVPIVAALTAHAAKFPDATKAACGAAAPLPEHLKDLNSLKEKTTILENDPAIVADYIERFHHVG